MTSLDEEHLRLAEALVFASTDPVPARALQQLLPVDADAQAVLSALRERCAGRAVTLVEVAGGWQFRTAPDLAPMLRKIVQQPRRLPRAAMETLAIIAYHQPVTRPEIEEMRGTSLSQQTMDALLEAGLIAAGGRKEVPGRPTLWGTTPAFLVQFGLRDLRDLPKREDLLVEPPPVVAVPVEDAPPPADEATTQEEIAGEETAAEGSTAAETEAPVDRDDFPPQM